MRAVVIGAGASGLMCAALLARGGADVTVIERNSKAGKKLFITGKGRCNLTNDCDVSEWLASTVNGAKFLYSAAHAFPPSAVKDYFESIGLRLKTERGKRVFPCSDKSSDVIKALVRDCERGGVKFLFDKRVTAIETDGGRAVGVRAGQELYFADAVVVATGGVTYPSTGSTGDGCAFARSLDLIVVDPKPSLVPLRTKGTGSLGGLALKNVRFDVEIGGKVVASEFGEMQFERGAVTGPIVLTCSALTCKYRDKNGLFPGGSKGIVDFKPALDEATLDARLLREFSSAPTAKLKVVAQKLLPSVRFRRFSNAPERTAKRGRPTSTRRRADASSPRSKTLTFPLSAPRARNRRSSPREGWRRASSTQRLCNAKRWADCILSARS